MLKNLQLRGVGPARKMAVDFAQRLNVLTGDNGLGKSFVLDIAWWALTLTWPGQPAWPRKVDDSSAPRNHDDNGVPVIVVEHLGRKGRSGWTNARYSFSDQDWDVELNSEPPDPGLVIYARVDGSFSVWDPARNRIKGEPFKSREESHRPPAMHFTSDQVWDGWKDGSRVLCKGLIEDWTLWQKAREPAFELLRDVLCRLSPDEREMLMPGKPCRVWRDDVRDIPTLKTPYGSVPVTLASAGIRRILTFAYMLVWTWQEHLQVSKLLNRPREHRILFLIDELESHLHPKWQRTLLPSLLPLADALRHDATECQIITTTHAPLALASLEPIFDPERDAIFVFDLEGGDVKVSKDPWRPRGDASAWLTSEIFDLEQARSLPAERAIAEAMRAMRKPDLNLGEVGRIHKELHKVLKDSDPFWVRWRYRAEQAGLET